MEPNKITNNQQPTSFWSKINDRWISYANQIPYVDLLIVIIGVSLALLLRFSLRTFESQDYQNFFRGWYTDIKAHGFVALGEGISNYTPLYFYMLYGISIFLPKVATVTAVKLPSIACDFICAWYAYRIVRLKYTNGPVPIFAFFAILFAPTVILNSSAWNQIESIYTAALIAFIYYILKNRNWLACIAFGIAFAVKLQSIYLAPLLLVLLLKRVVSWKHILAIPAVYLISIIPAWIAGRPLLELLTIYVGQVGGYAGLEHNAPNMYTWFPANMYQTLYPAGVIFAVSICLIYVAVILKSRVRLSKHLIVQLALLSALLVPYFLPKSHDRYFYPSDILSIVYGFFFPGYFYIPLAANLISFFIYEPFLFGTNIFPQTVLALALLIVIIIVIRQMMLALYKPEADPLDNSSNETGVL
jgi:Gpi18-like mannosyltransferase